MGEGINWIMLGSRCAAVRVLVTAFKAFCAAAVCVIPVHVAQAGATAARAPARAAWVTVPYIRNACPNQYTAISKTNNRGRTIAASATSDPRPSRASIFHRNRCIVYALRYLSHILDTPKIIIVNARATPYGTFSDSGLSSETSAPGMRNVISEASIRAILRRVCISRRL